MWACSQLGSAAAHDLCVKSLRFAFWACAVSLPSEVPSWTRLWGGFLVYGLFSFSTHSPGVQVPNLIAFVSLFVFNFSPTSLWGDWFAFLEVWDPLPVSRRCPVELFHMHMSFWCICWGGRWSPCFIPTSTWKCPLPFCVFQASTDRVRLAPTSPNWKGSSALLNLLIQMLISPRNTLRGTQNKVWPVTGSLVAQSIYTWKWPSKSRKKMKGFDEHTVLSLSQKW